MKEAHILLLLLSGVVVLWYPECIFEFASKDPGSIIVLSFLFFTRVLGRKPNAYLARSAPAKHAYLALSQVRHWLESSFLLSNYVVDSLADALFFMASGQF